MHVREYASALRLIGALMLAERVCDRVADDEGELSVIRPMAFQERGRNDYFSAGAIASAKAR